MLCAKNIDGSEDGCCGGSGGGGNMLNSLTPELYRGW